MEKTRTTKWTIGGMVLLTGALVAWLVPPTTPKGPDGSRPSAAAGSTRPFPPALPEVDLPLSSSADPAPEADSPAREVSAFADDAMAPVPAEPRRAAAPPEEIAGAEDDAEAIPADPEALYDDGYRWAREQDVQDRRECRRLDGGFARDGCRAYLADLRDDGWRPRDADEASR